MIAILLSLFAITANAGSMKLADSSNQKIFGGIDAPDGMFPYMVALADRRNGLAGCGGSVLTANAILTAGHCCGDGLPESAFIYAGSQTLLADGTFYNISSATKHPDGMESDLCIIKMQAPMPLGPNIAQVTLPQPSLIVPDQADVTIIGWGSWEKPDLLLKLQMGANYTAPSQEKCKVPATKMCILPPAPGQSTCFGDSGSPLIYNEQQVGIDCCLWCCQQDYILCLRAIPHFMDPGRTW